MPRRPRGPFVALLLCALGALLVATMLPARAADGSGTVRPVHAVAAAGALDTGAFQARANGGYAFLAPSAAGPAHWNRCATVPVRVNWSGAPRSFRADLTEALRRLSAASGLRFAVVGSTSYVPMRPGWEWDNVPAALYVAWTTPSQVPQLAGPTAGYSGPLWVPVPGREPRIIEAGVALDRTQTFRPGFVPGNGLGDLLLHELGHAVGLAHVGDPTQVMYPAVNAASTGRFGSGDLAGLRRLAAYPCFAGAF